VWACADLSVPGMLTNQDHQATPLNFTSLDTLLRLGTDWLSFEAPWGFSNGLSISHSSVACGQRSKS
jgi:hypothetical protein